LQKNSYEEADEQNAASALVQQWMAAFNAHDAQRIAALYAEDAELFDTGMKRARRGRAEITTWFTQRFQKMPTIQYTPTQIFLRENEVVVCWMAKGQTPALLHQRWLSRPFEVEGVSIFRLRSNCIFWQHGFYDHLYIAELIFPALRWLPLRL
jgi:uncharacterized protein (TIGR02246 family)